MQSLRSTTNRASTPAQDCTLALLDALPAVMWFVRRQMRSRRATGLSVPQFRALVHLSDSPDGTVSAIADKLGVSVPSASRLITGLVRRGSVVRRGSTDDRRQTWLRLTPRGETELRAAWKGTRAAISEKLAALSVGELEAATRMCRLLGRVFDENPHAAADANGGPVISSNESNRRAPKSRI
jgi:DNA-binding MarR family transcriptional regulator